jgi:hypothetical protein
MPDGLPSAYHPNERPNFVQINLPKIQIWFSYQTPIAFRHDSTGFVARENDWGPTTGKHLGMISINAERVPGEEFERQLALVLNEGDYVIAEERDLVA